MIKERTTGKLMPNKNTRYEQVGAPRNTGLVVHGHQDKRRGDSAEKEKPALRFGATVPSPVTTPVKPK